MFSPHKHTHTQGQRCMKGKTEIGGGVSTSQGMPKIVGKSLEIKGEAWNEFFLTAHRRKEPCPHLDLTQASGLQTVRY